MAVVAFCVSRSFSPCAPNAPSATAKNPSTAATRIANVFVIKFAREECWRESGTSGRQRQSGNDFAQSESVTCNFTGRTYGALNPCERTSMPIKILKEFLDQNR